MCIFQTGSIVAALLWSAKLTVPHQKDPTLKFFFAFVTEWCSKSCLPPILPFSLQYSPERSSSILLACCVLHNASLQSGLDAWTLERTDPLEQPDGVEQRPEERDSQAEELRKQLILKHFSWCLNQTTLKSSPQTRCCWCRFLIFCWFLLYWLH